MKYFKDCVTVEQVKARYRDLAKKWHPDRGGCKVMIQAINAEYEQAISRTHHADYSTATGDKIEEDLELGQMIAKLSGLPDIDIEICGCWLWISGLTKAVSTQLKDMGCRWSPKKTMWYWHSGEKRKRFWKSDYTIDDIRLRHGSVKVNNNFKKGCLA